MILFVDCRHLIVNFMGAVITEHTIFIHLLNLPTFCISLLGGFYSTIEDIVLMDLGIFNDAHF